MPPSAAATPPTFAPGNTVFLNSGGPGMTVVDVGQHSGAVWCRWVTPDSRILEQSFPADGLTYSELQIPSSWQP